MKTATIILVSVLLVSPASAEWYVGGYGGVAIPADEDVDGNASTGGTVLIDGTLKDVDLENSAVFGVKVGHFFEAVPNLGVELEAYHFRPDADAQTVELSGTLLPGVFPIPVAGQVALNDVDIDVTAIVLNVLYRSMFQTSANFPRGRIQPYVGVGGGAFMANLETTVFTAKDDDTDIVAGFQALVGSKFFLIPNLAMFFEYKFLQTTDFEFNLSGTVAGVAGRLDLESDLTSHMIYGGIAWHFW